MQFNARIEQVLSSTDKEDVATVEFDIIRDAKLLDCIMTTDETCISSVSVRIYPVENSIMGPKDVTIDCGCLLLCGNYECDIDIFSAVNDAGLIYDGGLVVNEVELFKYTTLLCLFSTFAVWIHIYMPLETAQSSLDDLRTRFLIAGTTLLMNFAPM